MAAASQDGKEMNNDTLLVSNDIEARKLSISEPKVPKRVEFSLSEAPASAW